MPRRLPTIALLALVGCMPSPRPRGSRVTVVEPGSPPPPSCTRLGTITVSPSTSEGGGRGPAAMTRELRARTAEMGGTHVVVQGFTGEVYRCVAPAPGTPACGPGELLSDSRPGGCPSGYRVLADGCCAPLSTLDPSGCSVHCESIGLVCNPGGTGCVAAPTGTDGQSRP